MRVLYSRVGIPYSPFTGKQIKSQTISQIVDRIKELPKTYQTPTMAPFCKDEEKYEVISSLVDKIKNIKAK